MNPTKMIRTRHNAIKRFPLLLLAAIIGLLFAHQSMADSLGTHSFTNKAGIGTYPMTLTYASGVITVDLSAIRNAQVYRAIFDPNRLYSNSGGYQESDHAMENMIIQSGDGATLAILPPRFRAFDATTAVRQIVESGDTQLRLTVVNAAGLGQYKETLFLEVLCDFPLPEPIVQVAAAKAFHRSGDTLITFDEVDSPLIVPEVTCDIYKATLEQLDAEKMIRYRIYRSLSPITLPQDIIDARLIDEIKPLSCWNPTYYGESNCTNDKRVPRLPVEDLTLATPGTGIYVHRFAGNVPETAYYYISRSVDGAEDFTSLSPGASISEGIPEGPGYGLVLEQKRESPASFMYVNTPKLHYYVRWECPPTHNLPSVPYNYLVAEPPPDDAVVPAPVDVALHCWGGSLNSGYGWWYRAEEGSLLLATNQFPYDWWTAYHENLHTLKSFADGTVQPFNQVRVLSFLFDFVAERFQVDPARMLLSGSSMGGSGASMWGMRSGHIFSHIISWVGIHTPAGSSHFLGSFESVFGKTEWGLTYSNQNLERFGYEIIAPSDHINVFDYWDTTQWLKDRPLVETPYISFANGKNDSAIGWPQAHDYVRALIETQRPFNFHWGMGGHSERAQLIDGNDRKSGLDFSMHKPLPVFQHCSLDDDLGLTPDLGMDSGQINRYLTWNPATSVETMDRLEMDIRLIDAAPQDTATVDVGFRRLSVFTIHPGEVVAYTVLEGGESPMETGRITADAHGIISIPGIVIQKGSPPDRIVLSRTISWNYDEDGDLDVDGEDLMRFIDNRPAGNWEADHLNGFGNVFGRVGE